MTVPDDRAERSVSGNNADMEQAARPPSLPRHGAALAKRLLPRRTATRLLLLSICSASVAAAQSGGADQAGWDVANWTESDPGIPVTDRLTRQKCGTCHAPDEKGNLSRISWIRSTPEGWSQAIKRMVRLNGLSITPDEARSVVKYLSDSHGLAPEEALPVMYIPERRVIDETIIPNKTLQHGCAACHAFGQPMSSRRSRTEWALLQNLHVAMYPQAEAQYNRPAEDQPAGVSPDAKPKDKVTRREVALDWLSENAGLISPEWAAWRPRAGTPQLAGKWLVSASLPGKGRYVGELVVTPGKADGDFKTAYTLHSLTDGSTLTRNGSSIVYTGYSWRGTSTSPGAASGQPDDPGSALRETLWFSPDQTSAKGRWYWGEYHEFGYDVALTRASGAPVIAAVGRAESKTGARNVEVHIYGADLPSKLTPKDISLGSGVTVSKVVSAGPAEAVVTIDVAADAPIGLHDVAIRGAVLQQALPVYDKVDYLKVTPETSLAHLGGIKFAKGYQPFEAIGFAQGPDGKPNTADDFAIGPVPVTWSMAEFPTVTYDNDVNFVGKLGADGLFTPAVEGPNPERRFSRNNYGEVWVVATAKNEKDPTGKPLTARSYLVVTVPTYKRWDQPEVSQ
ncbi:quinohemoprotein amine dehydrogenase subunit alpha [Altererythrobacter sp. B11]|uniref:quinohemoprotein amine dehydrogenase subunit alpha n=1 Tax=Altererythrobacter sp. B11 TaxID=2060312 RepID=UPI000DC71A38|nr:quinohemoprotein amine dehydrogenase subunit alpha [Altererythrobacter sp. B11]BBC73923.1 quinohemoprotein amine dehydrogenase subunit alpha [Altererythrobacter sp. B11]